MSESIEQLNKLEELKDAFDPSSFRLMMAEALVYFFSREVKSKTEIMNRTNKVLKKMNAEPISMGFVRNKLHKREGKKNESK